MIATLRMGFVIGFGAAAGVGVAAVTFFIFLGVCDWLSEFINFIWKVTKPHGVKPGESLKGETSREVVRIRDRSVSKIH